jgi:predicted N-acyltransferase
MNHLPDTGFKVYGDIDSVPLPDSLYETDPFSSPGWLKTFEYLCRRRKVEYSYLAAMGSHGYPSAMLPMYMTTRDSELDSIDSVLFGRFEGMVKRAGISAIPSLKVGIPYSSSGLAMQIENGEEFTLSLVEEARRIALDAGASLYLPRIQLGTRVENKLGGSVGIASPPPTRLAIRWKTFEEYLQWLGRRGLMKSKKVRRESRLPEKRGTSIEVIDTLAGFREAAPYFACLSSKIFTNFDSGVSPYDEKFFVTLKRNMGDSVVAYVARNGGDITAQTIALKSRSNWAIQFGGNDRGKTRGDLAWMNVVFYRPTADAIQQRVKMIEYGTRSYEYKLRRGCELIGVRGHLILPGRLKRRIFSTYSLLANILLKRKYGLT